MNGTTRTALVTGSAQGIGLACAVALAATGHRVIGVDVSAHDGEVFDRTVKVDLSDPAACRGLIDEIGRVDVLVNNAAILHEVPIGEFTVDQFDQTLAVNLRAPFLLSQAASVGMAERGWGRIVNVASVAARTGGLSDSAVYAASKAGLVSLTRSFARHLGGSGLTANAINPGGIATPMANAQFERSSELLDRVLAQIPAGRLGEGREVAAVVSFLASEEAAFVNGVTVDVNGGWVMG